MGNTEIRADVARNRLYVIVQGFLTSQENNESVDKILEALRKLRPGFDMITDMATMKVATEEGSEGFGRAHEAIKAMGQKNNILVVKDPLVRMQIERMSREAGTPAEFASSIEEAERILEGKKQVV
ncbi:hypothetical protein ACFLW2_02095 [Chloroflexota bacterium]